MGCVPQHRKLWIMVCLASYINFVLNSLYCVFESLLSYWLIAVNRQQCEVSSAYPTQVPLQHS